MPLARASRRIGDNSRKRSCILWARGLSDLAAHRSRKVNAGQAPMERAHHSLSYDTPDEVYWTGRIGGANPVDKFSQRIKLPALLPEASS